MKWPQKHTSHKISRWELFFFSPSPVALESDHLSICYTESITGYFCLFMLYLSIQFSSLCLFNRIYNVGQIGDWPITPESGVGAASFSVQTQLSCWSEDMVLGFFSHNHKQWSMVTLPLFSTWWFDLCNSRSTVQDENTLIRIYLGIYSFLTLAKEWVFANWWK